MFNISSVISFHSSSYMFLQKEGGSVPAALLSDAGLYSGQLDTFCVELLGLRFTCPRPGCFHLRG